MFSEPVPRILAGVALAACLSVAPALGQSAERLSAQREQYDAERAKSILELQPFRQETSVPLPALNEPARLISLSPASNAWFLLLIGEDGARNQQAYHIENPDPKGQTLALADGPAPALVITGQAGVARCAPWAGEAPQLAGARDSGLPYAPICDGQLYLLNKVSGARTSLERTTDFLRDNVWGGEDVVRFIRDSFFKDAFAESGKVLAEEGTIRPEDATGIAPARSDHAVITTELGLGLSGARSGQMAMGLWYPVAGLDGVYASAIKPKAISPEIFAGPGKINRLDGVEAGANDYMVAFDLSRFDLGFALGTDHPRLDWSPRPPASVRNGRLPGPDGVASSAPLVRVGMVSPALTGRTVAAFTAGFKRQHGAFKWGPFATVNHGSHYGFIEQGVIFSKLQPGLSTIYVLDDGTIGMKTWESADDALLSRIRFARQNGVPLLEADPETGLGVPGDLVTNWGPGNWSGSADVQLRTLRAGACMLESGGKRLLVYGYFSTATPSAMARTFQAYGCRYAMLLDMNALEHTYLALYVRQGGKVHVEHLMPGMSVIDKKGAGGSVIPRFLGFPDNRDFFYLTRREGD